MAPARTPAPAHRYSSLQLQRKLRHSLLSLLILLAVFSFALGLYKGGVHLAQLEAADITIQDLPAALFLSFMRMTASFVASLVFSFSLGLIAARSATGERVIIPLLDILQSVPVVAFFPAAISVFIGLSGGHRLGIELAAVFLIFTSQAWNMAFAVYEATKTIPQDNFDAVTSFGVRGSQRFWTLYAPACVPRLVYNSILSWSNGWFFLVACEIIAVGQVRYDLPGIGSFLARAAEQDRISLVLWGLLALGSLILALDFFVWRPASIWSERFRQDYSTGGDAFRTQRGQNPMRMFHREVIQRLGPIGVSSGHIMRTLLTPLTWILRDILLPLLWDLPATFALALWRRVREPLARFTVNYRWLWVGLIWAIGIGLGAWAGFSLVRWLRPPWPGFVRQIPLAILASTLRLTIALAISLAWILPIVLLCWNRPRLRAALNTLAQIGASLPAIALFPLIILVAVRRFGGGMEVASVLLLLTGMQWYILFNSLGGASIIPGDLAEAARAYGLTRFQTWRRIVLPAIRPALITGCITAWGGGWNALVVSEYVTFKDETLSVRGLGALLNRAVYELGDSRAIMICIAAMISWILIINSLVWRPLYQSAAERYRFDV